MADQLDRLTAALADRYTIEREIGAGGMATVYLAEDLKHHRKVALKVLRPELAAALGSERFLREIEIAAGLTHPHILPLHDSGEAEGYLYYVMPYIEGESLRDRMTRERQLPIDEAVEITREVADGLAHAHDAGVVHRDIKPENILLSGGHAVIADFGIARAVDAAGTDRLTQTGFAVGTPAYMSPEQATAVENLDGRSDIYSLGSVLYEMLGGDPPFTASTPQAILARKAVEPVPSLRVVRETVPETLESIVAKSLAKAPADRFATAAQFAKALRDAQASGMTSPAQTLGRAATVRLEGTALRWRPSKKVLTRVIAIVPVAVGALWFWNRSGNLRWAREEALPEIARLIDDANYSAAFRLAQEAEEYLANDPILTGMWPEMSQYTSVRTDPPGADVYLADYGAADGGWELLGTTPIDSARIPLGFFHWKLEKAGYRTVEAASSGAFAPFIDENGEIALDEEGSVPEDMVRIPGGDIALNTRRLGSQPLVTLEAYLMDRYEVTNGQFKVFIDSGGYREAKYWKHDFVEEGRELSWNEAMEEFLDATGRPGPANWELGDYPDGQDDYPVTGVSWYEAAAYLEFVGKTLPTVYHWDHAAGLEATEYVAPASNFSRRGPSAVGSTGGLSPYGTYDMAGNVKEWCWNEAGEARLIMGGAWNESAYLFNEPDSRPPFDRSSLNGFRGMRPLSGNAFTGAAAGPILPVSRDYATIERVRDDIYGVYERLYSYDKTDLNAVTESVDDRAADWIRERVSFDAAYGGERVTAYLFLPRDVDPPYQTVIYFPTSGAIRETSSRDLYPTNTDFLLVSGRAVMFPIYKGTYERGDALTGPFPESTGFYRDHVVMWSKDIGRSIDYLETRTDIDAEKLAFMGNSWGGGIGPIMTAVEPRFLVSMLLNGGLFTERALPEADQITFVPRVTIPVLMLNGEHDHVFAVEQSQKPMLRFFGASDNDKRHVLFDSGHELPRNPMIKEVLDWLDRYLGPAR